MKYDIYYIDAFTDKLFSGNPAAVIFSDISDSTLMQNIAAENNLSETAFIREDDGNYHIRWFSPHCEIDLCGHATLASAYVFFNYISPDEKIFSVRSLKNGILTVSQNDDLLLLLSIYLSLQKEPIQCNQQGMYLLLLVLIHHYLRLA